MALSMDGLAIGNGILTVENEAQALVRADPAQKDKGGEAAKAAIALLAEDDGLAHAGKLIRDALEPRLRETAYALACEVVAADRFANQGALRMLDFVRGELHLDPLVAVAIERATRARHQRVEG